MQRIAVFLDYQNVSLGARDCFFPVGSPTNVGNVDPMRLSQLLVSRRLSGGVISAVHVYRGIPESQRDPKGYGAALKQQAAHEATGGGLVRYHVRPLRYPLSWPKEKAQEKGVDVALAVDYVSMAIAGLYDVGILFSTDSDLRPALEAVVALGAKQGSPRCEVAAWRHPHTKVFSPRLRVKTPNLWCHWLTRADHASVADPTNYARP